MYFDIKIMYKLFYLFSLIEIFVNMFNKFL
jgi:hypothetical protein